MGRALLLAFCWLLASALVFMAAEGRHARCTNGLRCLHGQGQQNGNPKVRAGTAGSDKDEVLLKGSMKAGENGETVVAWELRRVPSGPDPLHHNGSPPKKPQTP